MKRVFTPLQARINHMGRMGSVTGFTLIELLIASAVFGAVLVSIYAAFQTGMFGYKRIDETIRVNQEARRIMERINQDLRNAFPYSEDNTANFTGSAEEMKFFTLIDSYTQESIVKEYASVEYKITGNQLTRKCLKGRESKISNPTTLPDEMADNVEAFYLKYIEFDPAGAKKEKDTWGQAGATEDELKKIPAGVKITLTLTNFLNKVEELKNKKKLTYTFERTIYLP